LSGPSVFTPTFDAGHNKAWSSLRAQYAMFVRAIHRRYTQDGNKEVGNIYARIHQYK